MTIARRWVVAILAGLAVASCALLPDHKDVDAFVARREVCDHLRGEFPDPPNPERVKEITDGVKEYCTGTDAKLAALKSKYAKDYEAVAKLNTFEPRIEATSP